MVRTGRGHRGLKLFAPGFFLFVQSSVVEELSSVQLMCSFLKFCKDFYLNCCFLCALCVSVVNGYLKSHATAV